MTEQRERTADRLARVLEGAGLPLLAQNARRSLYDDFRSPAPFPITLLVEHLTAAGPQFAALVERAKAGEFDAEKWEGDEWAASPEGRAVAAEFSHLYPRNAFGQPL